MPVSNFVILVLSIAVLFPHAASHAQTLPEDPQNFHIFLMMGQSNMAGYQDPGSPGEDGPPDTETHPRIFKLNAWGSWELAQDPIPNEPGYTVGPGMSFAKKMVSENEDIAIGLIPLAVGATRIDEWRKGSVYYQSAISAANYARNFGVIKGILWHQGEHNGIQYIHTLNYLEELGELSNDLRKDLKDVEIPFITAGFAKSILNSAHIYIRIIWDSVKENARNTYKAGYVRTMDLPDDEIHFSVQGQRTLGERLADQYLTITGYWNQKAKQKIDAEAEVLDGGWKYHPSLGLYYDEHFPLIKHAQLNWVIAQANPDDTFTFRSRFFGQLRSRPNPPRGGLYLYRESTDPELPDNIGDIIYVSLLADTGSEKTFYNHTTKIWSATIEELPTYQNVGDYNRATEKIFAQTQEFSSRTVESSGYYNWNTLRHNLVQTEETRLLTILLAQELYWYAHRNIPDPVGAWWKEHAMGFLTRIDMPLLDAQIHYQQFVNRVYSGTGVE